MKKVPYALCLVLCFLLSSPPALMAAKYSKRSKGSKQWESRQGLQRTPKKKDRDRDRGKKKERERGGERQKREERARDGGRQKREERARDGERQKREERARDGERQKREERARDGERQKREERARDGGRQKREERARDGERQKREERARDGERQKREERARDGERQKREERARDGERQKREERARDGERQKREERARDGERQKREERARDGERQKREERARDGERQKREERARDGERQKREERARERDREGASKRERRHALQRQKWSGKSKEVRKRHPRVERYYRDRQHIRGDRVRSSSKRHHRDHERYANKVRKRHREEWRRHRGRYHNWHGYKHRRYRYRDSYNYWGIATWGMITEWLIFITGQPAVYNRYDYDVRLEGDVVIINGETVVTVDRYAREAWELATSAPPLDPDESEWMPLGVFALVPNELVSEPTLFLQLNISREGVISGIYENVVSGQIQSIEGQVDRRGVRAAWTFPSSDNPIFDTGVANLSEEATTVLLHFDSGRTQEWVLVRLEGE